MADAASSIQVPILEDSKDAILDKHLRKLENFLRLFGFCQYSLFSIFFSWLAFLLISVALPVFAINYYYCSNCQHYEIKTFEYEILFSQALVAAISLFCISYNLRKYGVRKLLFVDRYHGHVAQFTDLYVHKIQVFYRLVVTWVLICLLLRTAREVIRVIYLYDRSWLHSMIVMIISLLSWTYSTVLFLLGAALFNLVGNLQVIHFENYGKLLEKDLDVSVYIEEHMRLTYNLSKISHRFRIFLLMEFLVVTACQFASLLQTTGNMSIINFVNAGDFLALSMLQLVGIVLCLNTASKISHRAQAIGSVASRWHALVTCNSCNDANSSGILSNGGNLEGPSQNSSLPISYSESDLESSTDYLPLPANTNITSQMTSYQKRQAFVQYVQSNTGGFTIFGWLVDRILINTIFFIELSLVFFVLGKTISITTR